METKPYQILLRNYEKQKIERLIKHYENIINGVKFTRVDIIRIAIDKLYKNVIKNDNHINKKR